MNPTLIKKLPILATQTFFSISKNMFLDLANKNRLRSSGLSLLIIALCVNAAPLKAEDIMGSPLVWMDASKNVVVEGDLVKSWSSSQGEFTAAPPEGSSSPCLIADSISGKPAIEFSEGAYLIGKIPEKIGPEVTFMVVANISSTQNTNLAGVMIIDYKFGINVMRNSLMMRTYSRLVAERYGEDNVKEYLGYGESIGSTPDGFNEPSIITAVFGVESCSLYVNGELKAQRDIGAFPEELRANSTQLGLGASATLGANAMLGQIAEALLYGEALTPESRQSIEKALATKYSITLAN
jgi:hypothetical protein